MQRLEVSGAVRPIYGSLGVKRLRKESCIRNGDTVAEDGLYTELGTGHSQEGTTAEQSD